MADVHLIITGMIALIPQRHGGVRILLRDLSRAHHTHQAHLLAEQALVTGRTVSFGGNHWKNGRRLGVWTLHGETIRILNDTEGGLHINPKYIIRMREIVGNGPGAAKISKSLDESDDPSLIAARLTATAGTLSATWVHPMFTHEAVPPHGSDPGPRFTAEEVCLNFQIAETSLRLQVDRFGGGGSYTLEIKPDDKGRIEVQLGNLVPHEIIFAQAPQDPVKNTKDPHFSLYYDMCGTQPQEYPNIVFRDSSAQPLPDPPQRLHPHVLTMGFLAQFQAARESLRGKLEGELGNTGSHNCPPVLWEEQ